MEGVYKLLDEVTKVGGYTPEYYAKMMHPIPETESIDRGKYILEKATDKNVLDLGCTGALTPALQKVVKKHWGIDIVPEAPGVEDYYQINLDKVGELPDFPDLELIVAGEVIEHLSNAGHFLNLLRGLNVPIILTTPNAHSISGKHTLKNGIENVNKEHVAWYSYTTLKTLVERHSFRILEWFWYNGKPMYAEGLIFFIG